MPKAEVRETFIIYDARAPHMGTENAQILDTADSLEEAQEVVKDLGGHKCACIYSYEMDGLKLTKETGPLWQ